MPDLDFAAIEQGLTLDRSAFKRVHESLFCQRHRGIKGGQTPAFHVDSESVAVTDSLLTALLVRQNDQRKFSLAVKCLEASRVRVTIDESNGMKERYRADDALDGPPLEKNFLSPMFTSDSLTVQHADGQKIVVTYRPFRLDLYSNTDDLVMSLNSQQIMKIEHFRERNTAAIVTDAVVAGDDKAVEFFILDDPEPEGEGFWHETFLDHVDHKPHGSSSISMDISFMGFEQIYGLPEHADSLALQSTTEHHHEPYRLYNVDAQDYQLYTPVALYGSVPYVMAHSAERSVAMLWLNASETWVDVKHDEDRTTTHWISESGLIDVFVMLGPSIKDVSRQYAKLTGTAPLPPLFSLAYHQCRWNYNDEDDVRQVDANFDKYHIPYDVLWLDIEHTDGKRYFTWDREKFPTPDELQHHLGAKERKLVAIIDPHIKRDDEYKVYNGAKGSGFFVKDRNGEEYDGHCWSGSSAYLDFFHPGARDYWATHFHYDNYKGSTPHLFVWNDMNEPSVFSGPEITMHKDAIHANGFEHRDVHNMYGFQQHRATYQGLHQREGGQHRPFVLTRSFFAGSQRYAAVWTGDNSSKWSHLVISIPMMMTLSISGISFVGADVGGFFGNPDEQLLIRWYQTGCFSPFFRAHAHINSDRREPWVYPVDTRNLIRDSIRRRYQMLVYWYTVFAEHERTGLPVLRPAFMEFPQDRNTFADDKQFMVGNAVLVHPVTEPDVESVTVYLPDADAVWYDWDTHVRVPGSSTVQVNTPLNKIPVFQRGGTVVPLKMKVRQSAGLMKDDPVTLNVALDKDNRAKGEIYVDDATTFKYQSGQFLRREFTWTTTDETTATFNNENADKKGELKSDVFVERVIVHGINFKPQQAQIFIHDHAPRSVNFEFDCNTMSVTLTQLDAKLEQDWKIEIRA